MYPISFPRNRIIFLLDKILTVQETNKFLIMYLVGHLENKENFHSEIYQQAIHKSINSQKWHHISTDLISTMSFIELILFIFLSSTKT